ncbi:FAD-dependent oxidoreductase [Sphingomonas sp.]|uniref:FAD-dependent oxidoreductase n=1 Tax=Sphingomonas sp. TaxID=28214 RepID=UPI0039C99BEF
MLGAGIAGLASAIALRGAGYRVELIEQASALTTAGAALSLWANAMTALRRLGIEGVIEREAAPIATLGVAARDGRSLMGPVAVQDAWLPTRSPAPAGSARWAC